MSSPPTESVTSEATPEGQPPEQPTHRKPRYGDRVEVTIERLDEKGQGVGTVDWPPFGAFRVAVRHAPPGSRYLVEVVRRRAGRVDAKRVRLLEAGPHAVEPRCEHYGTCGGCSFQSFDYGEQLNALRELVRETLSTAGALGAVEVDPVIGMSDPGAYRNKMDFSFGAKRWVDPGESEDVPTDFALGLHVPFRHDKVLDIHSCEIAFPEAAGIVNTTRKLALEMGLPAWNIHSHSGLLRHLVLRKGQASGEVLVYLVTATESTEQVGALVKALLAAHPEISTLVQGIHGGKATVAVGETEVIWHGNGSIREELLGQSFTVQPTSFFQTNTTQAERLIEVVREEVARHSPRTVFDLYCGTGLLGLMVTPPGGQLVGIERVASSVADARENAVRLGHPGAQFIEGDVLEKLDWPDRPIADVVVVDPPRAGLHPKVPAALGELGADHIVYVSCNIKTAARDVALLQELGWSLTRVRPIDLFPQTPHVECVLVLERGPR